MPPAASDTSLVVSERTAPPQNRRSTIHDNDSENMLVEAATYRSGGAECVEFCSYINEPDLLSKTLQFRLSLEEAAELHRDLGRFLAKRPTLLTTAKAGERAA